jgi:plasmid stabilization system protein ParE
MRIVFSSRANREVRKALEYYTRNAGAKVAFRLRSDLKAITERIKRWPMSFPLIDTEIRRAILKKFPFQVVYKIEAEHRIRILAVRHHKQNPDLGLES